MAKEYPSLFMLSEDCERVPIGSCMDIGPDPRRRRVSLAVTPLAEDDMRALFNAYADGREITLIAPFIGGEVENIIRGYVGKLATGMRGDGRFYSQVEMVSATLFVRLVEQEVPA